MEPVYVIKYKKYEPPCDTKVEYYELPFEEKVSIEKLKELLKKQLNIKGLTFSYRVGNEYHFDYTERIFFSDTVNDIEEHLSVEVTIALKVGNRYLKCEELDITVKN